MKKHLMLASILMILPSCLPHSQSQETAPNRPATQTFKMKPEVVRRAVERAFEKKEFSLNTRQSTVWHLETEWLRDGRYRSMVKADVKPRDKGHTELTLHLVIEKKRLWEEEWQPMDEVGRDAYNGLMNDIQMETYRVLYDGG
jgi:hypothetical protein